MNICKNCGKEIESHRIYCSSTCRNIYVNKNLRDYSKNGSSLRNKCKDKYDLEPKKCKICDSIIPYELRENVFCSKKCFKQNLHFFGSKSYLSLHLFLKELPFFE
jgi:predicted nucleic acid-binding Zn ribbon protein